MKCIKFYNFLDHYQRQKEQKMRNMKAGVVAVSNSNTSWPHNLNQLRTKVNDKTAIMQMITEGP